VYFEVGFRNKGFCVVGQRDKNEARTQQPAANALPAQHGKDRQQRTRTSASNLLYFVASRCRLARRAAASGLPPLTLLVLLPAANRGTSRAAVAISPSTRSVTCCWAQCCARGERYTRSVRGSMAQQQRTGCAVRPL
jgi:hypothetical protein